MCEHCGINHETNELEDQDAFDAFLDELLNPPAPTDYLQERGLTSEYDLTGTHELIGDWKVSVALVPKDQVEEEYRHHEQWWVLQGYVGDKLEVSTEGAPPEPVTAKLAAEIYAEYHFGYKI